MFCFGLPSLLFHSAADLRPTLVLGEHWLNAYWFWIGLPTLLCVLVGGWVGGQLSASGDVLVADFVRLKIEDTNGCFFDTTNSTPLQRIILRREYLMRETWIPNPHASNTHVSHQQRGKLL